MDTLIHFVGWSCVALTCIQIYSMTRPRPRILYAPITVERRACPRIRGPIMTRAEMTKHQVRAWDKETGKAIEVEIVN